jgi:hypothetical protein
VVSERVARLRQLSLEAKPQICLERAELVTEIDREIPAPGAGFRAPVRTQGHLDRRGRADRRRKGPESQSDPHLSGAVLPQLGGP